MDTWDSVHILLLYIFKFFIIKIFEGREDINPACKEKVCPFVSLMKDTRNIKETLKRDSLVRSR